MDWIFLAVCVAIIAIIIVLSLTRNSASPNNGRGCKRNIWAKKNNSPLSRILPNKPRKQALAAIKTLEQVRARDLEARDNDIVVQQGDAITRGYITALEMMAPAIDAAPLDREEIDDAMLYIHHARAIADIMRPVRNEDAHGGAAEELAFLIDDIEPAIAKRSIEERVDAAQAGAQDRADAAERYFESAVTYTNDRQNVHESKIVKGAQTILENMIKDNAAGPKIASETALSEVRAWVSRNESDPSRRSRALRTLAAIEEGSTVAPFNQSEGDILAEVWRRCNHPDNKQGDMREAVVNALVDSIENGSTVCATGRTERLLYAFTGLDADPAVAKTAPMTYEAYRGQIFTETNDILQKSIASAKDSDDDDLRNVATSYTDASVIPSEAGTEKFKSVVEEAIKNNVAKYEGVLSDHERQILLTECLAGVDI